MGGMTRHALSVLLACFAVIIGFELGLGAGCAHVPPNVVTWEQCVADQVPWQALVADVAKDLASDDYATLLDDLVSRFGVKAVQCAVLSFFHQSLANKQQTDTEKLHELRAKIWLDQHSSGGGGK
ncbi:MAG: hypothetical protein JOZ10_11065 [Acidobacteria bacterium]|nr:hypothetical protein [Acidobacteriota bacterium]